MTEETEIFKTPRYLEKVANPILYNQQPGRKNNDLVAAMYAMYQTGKSLAFIATRYKKSRQCIYDLFHTRGYPLRSKQHKGLQILDGHRFTYSKGQFLRGTVDGKRIHMSHYVWRKHTGQNVPKGSLIRYRDGNRDNNAFENLELLTIGEHTKKYIPKHNQFTAPNGSRIVRRNYRTGDVRLMGSKKFVAYARRMA